jgi:alginate O-acetyltransferase complex protein AlgI
VLFNSYAFLLGFLPATLLLYFAAGRWAPRCAFPALGAASLFFYAWWDPRYLALILGSIAFNFAAGSRLLAWAPHRAKAAARSRLLAFAVAANLLLLAIFKYADFFIASVNQWASAGVPLPHLILPLGISFFTFTQIAFLVDASRGEVDSLSPTNYGLFVSFFPHLIAGPILHHREMMPQFERGIATRFNADNFALGLYLLCLGLAKKMLLADQFAPLANAGFANWQGLDGGAAWITSLSYTLQLYFDFSGYTDMALGLAWMFNIRLPQNFDSPYKAVSIQQFWRRWHITLSRFLRDYLYFPLGGDRGGRLRTLRNLFLTFVLGGLWHGAGWTFIAWGALHGAAMAVHRGWTWTGLKLARWQGWLLTFLFVNAAWVYFRASTLEQANAICLRMVGLGDAALPVVDARRLVAIAADQAQGLFGSQSAPLSMVLVVLAAALVAVWRAPNSIALAGRFRASNAVAAISGAVLAFCLLAMHRPAEFLYFNF